MLHSVDCLKKRRSSDEPRAAPTCEESAAQVEAKRTMPRLRGCLQMSEAVRAGAIAVAALNALPAALGAWRWYREQSSRGFWIALRVAQVGALAYAVAVGVLAAAGHSSREQLFYLYALLPLAVAFVAEQLRVASAQTILAQRDLADAQAVGALPEQEQQAVVAAIVRREMGVMTLSALVVVFLAWRAAETAHGF
jgi:hypothetical protein